MVFPIFDTRQTIEKLLQTRHELVTHLLKLNYDVNLEKNTKWAEIKKEVAKIDELIIKLGTKESK